MGKGQEVTGRLLVAGCDAAVVLEAIEQPLDEIATLIFPAVVPPLYKPGFQRWNDCFGVALP